MGNFILAPSTVIVSDPCLLQYRTTSFSILKESFDIYKDFYFGKPLVDAETFDEIFGASLGDTEQHFKLWKARGDSTADIFRAFAAAAVYCEGKFRDRASLVFDIFDLDNSRSISLDELNILLLSSIQGMCILAQVPSILSESQVRCINNLATHIFAEIDQDQSKTISRSEFVYWCENDPDVNEYVNRYTTGTGIHSARAQFQLTFHMLMLRFDAALEKSEEKVVSLSDLIAFTKGVIPDLSNEEVELIMVSMGDREESIERHTFETLAQALAVFDTVTKGDNTKSISTANLSTLLWIQNGREPNKLRVEAEIETIGTTGDITRLQFLKSKCIDGRLDSSLQTHFELYDKDHSGKLDMQELCDMLYDTISRDYIGKKCIENSHEASVFLRSLSNCLAKEIMENVDVNHDRQVTYKELVSHVSFIEKKREALAHWILDHKLSTVTRYFSFDENSDANLQQDEISITLEHRIRSINDHKFISNREITMLAEKFSKQLMNVVDKNGDGSVDANEFHEQAGRILQIEEAILERTRQMAKARRRKTSAGLDGRKTIGRQIPIRGVMPKPHRLKNSSRGAQHPMPSNSANLLSSSKSVPVLPTKAKSSHNRKKNRKKATRNRPKLLQ